MQKLKPGFVAFYDLRPGNVAGPIIAALESTWGKQIHKIK